VRTLVVGVGNPIRGDDGIGPIVAERVARAIAPPSEFLPFSGSGLDLVCEWGGYERVVVIDSISTGGVGEGECVRIDLEEPALGGLAEGSSHASGILASIAIARRLDVALPGELVCYGIGVKKTGEFREGPGRPLLDEVERIVECITEDLTSGNQGERRW